MFTVCPKCALTLVVTAQDLRVAQGYVRCGRCSNVFNAIVGLTDDRGVGHNAGHSTSGSQQPSTATTSIIRKAPSLADEPAGDSNEATGETEMLYAEPDPDEVRFQEVFSDSPPPKPASPPFDSSKPLGPISFVAPPPGPPAKAPPPPAPSGEKRYSDTEGIDTYPEGELEFNAERTDITQVFVEAAPVTFRNNATTGTFEKIVLGSPEGSPNGARKAGARSAGSTTEAPAGRATGGGTQAPASSAAGSASSGRAAASAASGSASSASAAQGSVSPGRVASAANGASASGATNGSATSTRLPAAATPPKKAPASPAPPAPQPSAAMRDTQREASRDDEEDEDDGLDDELRSLATRIDVTASRPAAKTSSAANDEAIDYGSIDAPDTDDDRADDDEDEDRSIGDIYSRAKARPKPPPAPARDQDPDWAVPDSIRSELQSPAANADIQAVDAESLAPATPGRNRSMMWIAGAALLSVGLVAQAIHHNRHDLATNAMLNRPLTKLYGALGIPLVPNWDLRAYDVRQLGASTGEAGEGTLTVRASLKNGADQALPLPLLRITMQDRYGNRIATRDVAPKDYAPGAVPEGAVLTAGQRLDAEMSFKDPGQNAVGFEIDACLVTASGRIACANDQPIAAR